MSNKIKYRLKFIKSGNVRFIGHLDLMSLFNMAIKRAKLPIAYSEGFNPHQLLSFALPLSLGYHSNGEYLDMVLAEPRDCKEIVNLLNGNIPDGVKITAAGRMPKDSKNSASIVNSCAYKVILPEGHGISDAIANEFITQTQIVITKKTKKNLADVDIAPDIFEFITKASCEMVEEIYMRISAGPNRSVRADSVVKALFAFAGAVYPEHGLIFARDEMYSDTKGERPLLVIGEHGEQV